MELRHLRYFVAVAEEEHFGRAARRLHLSQPPLNRQVHQLEEEIGVALLESTGRGVRLTPAGRAFLDGARATLAESQRAVRSAQLVARGDVGQLNVAFVDNATCTAIVPEVVTRLRARRPDLGIDLQVLSTAAQWEALREGRIDAGFCYDRPDDPAIHAEVIFRDRVVLALPARHPLARKPRLRVRDLAGKPLIAFPRKLSPRYHDQVFGALQARGAVLNVVQESATDATRLSLVASGLGLTLVVESASASRPRRVVLRRFEDASLRVEALLIWRAVDERAPPLSSFLETTREVRDKLARARRG